MTSGRRGGRRSTAASTPAGRRKGGAPSRAPRRATSHRGRRIVAGLVVSALLVGFLLVGVFPTRTWLDQSEETEARQEELARIRAEQDAYEERIDELETPEEIEQIAREEHGMVLPDEEAYRILPPAVAPVELPETWPFTGASDWLNR